MKRVALLIGNANYQSAKFPNIENCKADAVLLDILLRKRGFETQLYLDQNAEQMTEIISSFFKSLDQNIEALVFYYESPLTL
ncbi:caspase family protein [Methylophilus sp. 'Pure River']|uniref:caspase family protein n=1 Tax=Methylophilus sp. 'Pure River' TaxID=3377117 RepID=UPI00398ED6A5